MRPVSVIQLTKLRYTPGAMGVLSLGIVAALSWLITSLVLVDPDNVQGILMGIFWACVFGVLLYRHEKRKPDGNWWWELFLAGLLSRLAAALTHIAVGFWFYGGAVDFIGYHSRGVDTGQTIFGDPAALSDYTLDRFIEFLHALLYFLTGPGLVGMFLMSGIIGFWGSYLFLKAFRVALSDEGDVRFLGLFVFLLPSLVFWASLLGKDSWVFFFLGWISYSFAHLVRRFRLRYLLGIVVGLGILMLVRPPVGAVMAIALGGAWFPWFLGRRAMGPAAVLRPVFLVGSALLVVAVTLTLVSRSIGVPVSVEIASLEEVASAAIRHSVVIHQVQSADLSTGSGSNVSAVFIEATPSGVLRGLPQAVFTALFRPFIFEAHNALALGAALETTFLVGLLLWRRRNLGVAVKAVFAKPFIGFCIASFVLLILIISVEGNLGAIARHRTMALPFLLSLLAVSYHRKNPRGLPS